MTESFVRPMKVDYSKVGWQAELESLAYAYGKPSVAGKLKLSPVDFQVTELMDFKPSGEGEHYWLDVTKTKCNTDEVAKALARLADVAYRDVGYSGLKDRFAETRQWFSVWKPKGPEPEWSKLLMQGVVLRQVEKHNRKIKRGTHRANSFNLLIRDLAGDLNSLPARLEKVRDQGVPNYFGAQRFGREANNMQQAYAMLVEGKKSKNRSLNSILLSSARAWLFNTVVSQRVKQQSWLCLQPGEPANLHGSNSQFISDGAESEIHRISSGDIHPTAPMWGQGHERAMESSLELHKWERKVLDEYSELLLGLERARVNYQRRPLRTIAQSVDWTINSSDLQLNFVLPRGQFATSVLRELVSTT